MHADPEVLSARVFALLERQKPPASLRTLYRLIDKVVAESFAAVASRRPLSEFMAGGLRTPRPDLPDENDSSGRLRLLIARLGDRDREILQLAHWDQLSEPEIAEILRLDRAAVASRLIRAEAKYARLVAREGNLRPANEAIADLFAAAKPGVQTRH